MIFIEEMFLDVVVRDIIWYLEVLGMEISFYKRFYWLEVFI